MISTIFAAAMLTLGAGDIHLPERTTAETPCVLLIHGGGWTGMSRKDVVGIADFLRRDLGCVVYNVDYRLATKATPWPACGEDCVAAAKRMFTDDFAQASGVRPRQIWIVGGSAGGHLALWTGLSLPAEQVAGIVSISGIADTGPDFACNPGRYRELFGGQEPTVERMRSANPIHLIRPNGPKVLCTHARGDKVVPIESARAFEKAYRAAGNEIDFHEYPTTYERGLTGHCIWIPGSKPHRLIPMLERRIAYFMRPSEIPEPRPVKSAVDVSAFYYPGTEHMPEWDMVEQTRPEIKPLLGWYDEGDPWNVDWQIKWAVEHGIGSFCVDWYWNRGVQRLDHWLKGFQEAKFRKYLKWYLMWANHDQPGAHSTEGQVAVTKWWLEHYFRTPEYYQIDGKPVVVLWSRNNLDRDFIAEAAQKGETLKRGEGCRRAMAISERLVREAGLPGIYWINVDTNIGQTPQTRAEVVDFGFKAQTMYTVGTWDSYRYCPDLRTKDDVSTRTSYELTAKACERAWKRQNDNPSLTVWPLLPTGWDDSPRSFQNACVVRDRTPELFGRVCARARAYCERTGARHVMIAPLNEWQEGSYIEPNEEYGFSMYEALRDAFCEKPAEGWPKPVTPKDLSLALHEFPKTVRSAVQAWNFDKSTEGWYRQPYGCPVTLWENGSLVFITYRDANYHIRQRLVPFEAKKYTKFKLRMKLEPNPVHGLGHFAACGRRTEMRIKWGVKDVAPIIESSLFVNPNYQIYHKEVFPDGEWHEYELPVADTPQWRGQIDELWLEAINALFVRVSIDWMRFE